MYLRTVFSAAARHLRLYQSSQPSSDPKATLGSSTITPATPSVVGNLPPTSSPQLSVQHKVTSTRVRTAASSPADSRLNTSGEDPFVDQTISGCIVDVSIPDIIPWETVRQCHPEVLSRLKWRYTPFKYQDSNRPTSRGVLLLGGQGTRKTTIYQSFAAYTNALLIVVTSAIKGGLQGQTER